MKNNSYRESINEIKFSLKITKLIVLTLFAFAGTAFAAKSNLQSKKVSVVFNNIVISKVIKSQSAISVQNQKTDNYITGIVKDETGELIIGANVTVKGEPVGVVTDAMGRFNLKADVGSIIIVSFIGYTSHEVKVGDKKSFVIILRENNKLLDEVIVVGYGVQKKSVVTASVSKVSADDLAKGTPTNVQDVLKGKVSGVQITSESGQPGMDSKIRIRGTGTVNDSEPLYIIDGMASSNGINYLNPSDIESIEILKDAASAAIYGARGANGVVLVTTKTGTTKQKTTLNYEFTYGIQNPDKKLDLMNSEEYQIMMNEMAANVGKTPYFPLKTTVDTDWQQELRYKNAPIATHKLSLSGGTENSDYYASFGYIKQSGIMAKGYSDYERYNGRLNYSSIVLNLKDRNWLNKIIFGSNMAYTRISRKGDSIDNSESGGIIASMDMLPPTEPVYQDDASTIAKYNSLYPNYLRSTDGRVYNIIELREIVNPLADLQANHNQRRISQVFNDNFNLNVSIFPGLKFKTTYGLEWGLDSNRKATPAYTLNTTNTNTMSKVEDYKSDSFSWQWENILSYDHSLGLHNVSAMLGTTMASYAYSDLSGSAYGLLVVDPNKAYIDIATGDKTLERVTGTASDHKLASVFGRINYNYDEKYLLEFVIRRDGSSNFSKENRYAVFPSVSAGWVITKEKFMNHCPDWIDFLKMRLSWGQNGNESIGAFGYTSMMSMGTNAVINGSVITGAKPSGYVNSNLKWETSEQTDLGFDLRLLKNSLTLSFDYFNKKTKDMLMDVNLPEYTGYYSMKDNVGAVQNRGLEFETSYRFYVGKVHLGLAGNASYVKNKVTNLGSAPQELDWLGGGLGGAVTWMATGKPYGFFYGYKTDGIFQNQKEIDSYVGKNGSKIQPNAVPGDVKYKDLDGDGTISDGDRTMIGDQNPKWTYGFSFNMDWNNFDLSAFFQGAAGNKIYKFYRRANILSANWEKSWFNRWHGEGTSNKYPRLDEGDPHHNTTWVSDLFVENGDYLRLKMLQLGYQLPQELTRKLFINKLRLFLQAENLFTITGYSGYDPEVGTRHGFDGGTYPQARTFTFGVNIVF
jgi:TonB-linked SusC/RagA family outer membrane protein